MDIKDLIDSSYITRYLFLNSVDISDYKVFPSREIQNAPPVFDFYLTEENQALLPILNQIIPANEKRSQTETIDEFLERNGTVVFLVIQNDNLLFERYYNRYSHSSICTSFSIAKSFVSAMIGIALSEKCIDQLDDPITKYLPELSASYWSAITIRHLISMSSGLKYGGGFFPWSDDPRIYYSLDLRKLARQAKRTEQPGVRFHYNNYNLILLGMMLERVTGGTVSAYLQEKIWKSLGMESSASWSLDSPQSGMEKMESGLNARAIDFAKFGRLYLRRGEWDGKQIVPESWVVESTTIRPDAKWTNYKYLWWIPRSGHGCFMAIGNLDQFMYVAPDKDCIIVRFGRAKPKNWSSFYPQMFAALVERL